MTDPIQITNNSLSSIGLQPIASFADGSTRSNLCRDKYPSARDAVLNLHPWNFATFYARLEVQPTTETSAYKWTYQYPLITDPYCLRVLETEQNIDFEIGRHKDYGRVLWSNNNEVRIKYIGRVEDTTAWTELAVKVLEKWLAAELAQLSSAPANNRKALMQEVAGLIPAAEARDATEGKPVVLTAPTTLIDVRGRRGTQWR